MQKEKLAAYLKGILSIIPGSDHLVKLRGTRKTIPSSYYYGIWLKHLTMAWQNGYQKVPDSVVEFGPGDSFGVGIAALLSGSNKYYGLDVVPYSNVNTNIRVFKELVQLFRARAARPLKGWPDFDAYLDERLFPSHILTDESLRISLHERRLREIEKAIRDPNGTNAKITIKYIVPWQENQELKTSTIDFCYSHSVLEYITNPDDLFKKIHDFLVTGGLMSHQVDLTGHNLSTYWNGHRQYSELSWKMIKGKRPYFLTRYPYSVFRDAINQLPFEVVGDLQQIRTDGLGRQQLSTRWQSLTEEDHRCAGMFIQAKKIQF